MAQDQGIYLDLEVGSKVRHAEKSRQVIEASTGTNTGTDGKTIYAGGNLTIGGKLQENAYLLPGFFGDTPQIELRGSYFSSKAEHETTLNYDIAAGQFVNIDGTLSGSNFLSADYEPKYQSNMYGGGLFIRGSKNLLAGFTPEFGLIADRFTADYELRGKYSNGSNRLLMEHELSSRSAGVSIGGTAPLFESSDNALSINLTPAVSVSYAKTSLNASQDPLQETGGMDTLSVRETEHHVIASPSIYLNASYQLGVVDLGFKIGATYVHGAPYMRLQDSGQSVDIDTSSSTYELDGLLTLSVIF